MLIQEMKSSKAGCENVETAAWLNAVVAVVVLTGI